MKKYIILVSVALFSVNFSSCNKFLDEIPDNRTEINSVDKVKSLLVSAYPYRFYASFLESRCDGVIDHGSVIGGGQASSAFAFTQTGFRWDEYPSIQTSDDAEQYWLACYGAIAAANHALEAIEKMGNTKEYAPYKAEAQLCRAYAHFCLLTLFSNFFEEDKRTVNPGIPYVTKPETVINQIYERGTVASTLEKIKADLAAGMANVGVASDFTQPKFHFTINAARMLALRIALFERDYPAVISYSSQLIPQPTAFVGIPDKDKNPLLNQDGTPVLIPDPSDGAFLFCKANLFDWNSTITNVSGSGAVKLVFSNAKSPNIILASEPYSYLPRIASSNIYTRYTHGNKEFNAIIGTNASGVKWNLPSYGYNSAGPNSPSFVPKVHEDFKVTNINANTGTVHARIALFRLEEALLARAEAYAMTGEYDKALADLTMYAQQRVRAVITAYYFSRDKVVEFYRPTIEMTETYILNKFNAPRFSTVATTYEGKLQRGLVMTVLDARRTEYLYEGMRWFDILRWNIPVTHTTLSGQSSTLTADDDRRVIQLPATAALSGLQKNRYENIPNPWN